MHFLSSLNLGLGIVQFVSVVAKIFGLTENPQAMVNDCITAGETLINEAVIVAPLVNKFLHLILICLLSPAVAPLHEEYSEGEIREHSLADG